MGIYKALLLLFFTALFFRAHLATAQVFAEDDQTAPEVCVMNADQEGLMQKMPNIAYDLATLNMLPLTGRGVYDTLTNPVHGIRTCFVPVAKDVNYVCNYNTKTRRVSMVRGTFPTVIVHEYFHARQDMTMGTENMRRLTTQDAAISLLLMEATAVAYELVVELEAVKTGVKFSREKFTMETRPDGILFHSYKSAAFDSETTALFNATYNKYLKKKGETKALEAAGKNVVRRLLNGGDAAWLDFYTKMTAENINNRMGALPTDGRQEAYPETRRRVFRHIGDVSPEINLIPEEYLGEDADLYIDYCAKRMGFRVVSTKAP